MREVGSEVGVSDLEEARMPGGENHQFQMLFQTVWPDPVSSSGRFSCAGPS